jgi:hypothetical protein
MFTPQLTSEPAGFGLGFAVGKFRNHRAVSHNGAVYGCSSSLVWLPDARLGVVVLGNEDIVNARIDKLAQRALSLMLEVKRGEAPPIPPAPITLGDEELRAFCGAFESQSYWASVSNDGGRLVAVISGQPVRLTPLEPLRMLADSRMHNATPASFERGVSGAIIGFTLGSQRFVRVPASTPDIPTAWKPFLGSYGPKFIPLVVSARHGHLYAMTENMVDYRLTPLNRHVFAFPPGLYADEHLVFMANDTRKPHSVSLANMILRRR